MKPYTPMFAATSFIIAIEITFHKKLGYGEPIPALGIIAAIITAIAWMTQQKDPKEER